MKKLTYILFLIPFFALSQTPVKRLVVDCDNNTIITSQQDLIVKQLTFVSNMLPMSYCSKLTVYRVVGSGAIVSPSTVTNRRPQENEQEPEVIVKGCYKDFPNLTIGKYVRVIYECNDKLSN